MHLPSLIGRILMWLLPSIQSLTTGIQFYEGGTGLENPQRSAATAGSQLTKGSCSAKIRGHTGAGQTFSLAG